MRSNNQNARNNNQRSQRRPGLHQVNCLSPSTDCVFDPSHTKSPLTCFPFCFSFCSLFLVRFLCFFFVFSPSPSHASVCIYYLRHAPIHLRSKTGHIRSHRLCTQQQQAFRQNQNNKGRPKTTIKFDSDFDFEQANTEFEEMRLTLTKLKVAEEAKPEQVSYTRIPWRSILRRYGSGHQPLEVVTNSRCRKSLSNWHVLLSLIAATGAEWRGREEGRFGQRDRCRRTGARGRRCRHLLR